MDKVFVNNLSINCIVGILPDERVNPQQLIISLELEKDLKASGAQGDLSKSIDYAKLSQCVLAYTKKRKARLLEELGFELCDLILKEFFPYKVTVRLAKPKAVAEAENAGIEISKIRTTMEI